MSAELLNKLSTGSFILACVFFALAIVLFFLLDILTAMNDLNIISSKHGKTSKNPYMNKNVEPRKVSAGVTEKISIGKLAKPNVPNATTVLSETENLGIDSTTILSQPAATQIDSTTILSPPVESGIGATTILSNDGNEINVETEYDFTASAEIIE